MNRSKVFSDCETRRAYVPRRFSEDGAQRRAVSRAALRGFIAGDLFALTCFAVFRALGVI